MSGASKKLYGPEILSSKWAYDRYINLWIFQSYMRVVEIQAMIALLGKSMPLAKMLGLTKMENYGKIADMKGWKVQRAGAKKLNLEQVMEKMGKYTTRLMVSIICLVLSFLIYVTVVYTSNIVMKHIA